MPAGGLLGLFATVGYFVSRDDAFGRGLAYFLGSLALVLFIIGGRAFFSRKPLPGRSPFAEEYGVSWRDDPATHEQKSFARDLGIKFPANITKGELSDLITRVTGK